MSDEIAPHGGVRNIPGRGAVAWEKADRDTPELYEFGPFRLDLAERRLMRGNEKVELTPKAFDTLVLLVRNNGHLLEKERFFSMLWPDSFVEEGSLSNNIFLLRRALGEEPVFIETVPRRGYRFVGTVRQLPPTITSPAEPLKRLEPGNEASANRHGATFVDVARPAAARHRWRTSAVIAAVLVAILAIGSVMWWRRPTRLPDPSQRVQSLVVLPFENLSADTSQDYFAAGITEELTTDLANMGAVRVVSHTSAAQFKGGRKPLSQIARELKVDGVVEGAVQSSADRVRITVQLIRVATDEHIWATTYDREAKDVLGIEEDVAREIASAIQLKLTATQSRSMIGRTANPAAWDAYLRGRYAWNERQIASLMQALDFFQRAIDIDPTFARAYAGLADTYAILGAAGYDGMPASEAMENARAAATKALELDSTLSDAHASLAFVSAIFDWNWDVAEREFQAAVALNPNNATAHEWYSQHLCVLGKWDQAISEAKLAQSLDPLSAIVQENLARPYYYSHRYDEAIELSKNNLVSHPDFPISHLRLGRAYAAKGMYAESGEQFQRFSELTGGSTLALASLANVRARAGDREAAERLLARLRIVARQKHVPAYQFAIVYSGLGNVDAAMKWLEKAYEERSDFLLYLRNETLFESLRADPRFVDLERRIGI